MKLGRRSLTTTKGRGALLRRATSLSMRPFEHCHTVMCYNYVMLPSILVAKYRSLYTIICYISTF